MKASLLIRKQKELFLLSLFFLSLFYGLSAQASHIRAGNIYYQSDTTAAQNPLRYFFTLVTYSDAPPAFEDLEATLHFGDCNSQKVTRASRTLVTTGSGNYFMNVYRFEHTYTGAGTYTATYTVGSQGGIVNIASSLKRDFYLESTIIVDPSQAVNHSPKFQHHPLDVPVRNHVFVHNSGALDAEGDSISFKLVTPKASNGVSACGNPISVNTPGYSGLENFLGTPVSTAPTGVTLNRNTGLLTWNTPSMQGTYNVTILVEEWRNRRLIGTMVRDMLFFALENPPVVTGVSEEWQTQVSAFPNPASSTLTMKVPAFIQVRGTSLYNAVGTPVNLPAPVKTNEGWTFDIQGITEGFYLLHLRTAQGTMVQKFIVKR